MKQLYSFGIFLFFVIHFIVYYNSNQIQYLKRKYNQNLIKFHFQYEFLRIKHLAVELKVELLNQICFCSAEIFLIFIQMLLFPSRLFGFYIFLICLHPHPFQYFLLCIYYLEVAAHLLVKDLILYMLKQCF